MATRGPAWVLGLRHPASRVSWSCAERWAETLLGGVAAAALTAGCGTGSPTGSDAYDLPTGQRAASTAAVVFATGEELHIGTRTYPIRPAPQTMVDTAGGLYYLTHGVLYQWDRDHEPSLRVATSAGSAGSRPLSTDASWRSSTTSTVPAILAATGSPRPSSSTRPPASNWCAMRPETDPGPAPRTCPTCTPNRPRPSWGSTTTRSTPRPRRAAPSPGGTWRTGTAATWGTTNTRSPRTDQAARSSTSTSCTVCRARRPRRKPVQLAVGGRRFRAGRLARRKQVLRPRRRRDQALHRAGDGVLGGRVAMHRSKSSGPCRGRQPSGVHHR
jgi:hypothetical protein